MNEILAAMLNSWRDVNEHLTGLREDQVKAMLDHEVKHARRWTVIERLHQRYNILRVKRERKELEHDFHS